MKKNFKGGDRFGQWTLIKLIDGGGNGEVWLCKSKTGTKNAIKLLKKEKESAFRRFSDEVNTILANSDIKGVIEIIDFYLPKDRNNEVPFYVMPVGQSVWSDIAGKNIFQIVDIIIEIAKTLEALHDRNVSHRDIKPSNILILKQPTLIDFGLVDFPEKLEITGPRERIGPRLTMAPEIIRSDNKNIDWKSTDVYALAKTLWMLLTGNKDGFEGQYSVGTILELKKMYKRHYIDPIDRLLRSSTDNNPASRPNISDFIRTLTDWKKTNKDFHLSNNAQWYEILGEIFPISTPSRAIWIDIEEIIKVLDLLSSVYSLAHMFLPDSGGDDLKSVKHSTESGCVEINEEIIVKPIRLIYESFGVSTEWNYFRLETGTLSPSGVYSDEYYKKMGIREDLTEISPGIYDHLDLFENRMDYIDMGHEIPLSARSVTRYFTGSFVIFNKRSTFNLEISAYDGNHNNMNSEQFKMFIRSRLEAKRKRWH